MQCKYTASLDNAVLSGAVREGSWNLPCSIYKHILGALLQEAAIVLLQLHRSHWLVTTAVYIVRMILRNDLTKLRTDTKVGKE